RGKMRPLLALRAGSGQRRGPSDPVPPLRRGGHGRHLVRPATAPLNPHRPAAFLGMLEGGGGRAMQERLNGRLLERVLDRVAHLAAALEKASVAEFIELYRRPRRLLFLNFLSGLSRGFGIAVGFTVVGALFLYVLGQLAALNLPIIGEFVADIIRIVQGELAAGR